MIKTLVKKFIFFILFLLTMIALPLAIFLFLKIFLGKYPNYNENFLGAFFGAFFAFSFLIMERLISKYYRRYAKHKNALVRLDQLLNGYFSVNNDNIYIVDGLIKSIEEKIFYYGSITELKTDEQLLLEFCNVDLINDVFSLYLDVNKTNHSLETMINSYNEAKLLFIDKKINQEEFNNHVNGQLPYLRLIKGFLENLDTKTEKIEAKNRILLKEVSVASILNSLIMNLFNLKYDKNFDKKILKELVIIKKEREDCHNASQKEINEITEKTNFPKSPPTA